MNKPRLHVHIPKTGGMFARRLFPYMRDVEDVHYTYKELTTWKAEYKEYKPFTFVRNPADWLFSAWGYWSTRHHWFNNYLKSSARPIRVSYYGIIVKSLQAIINPDSFDITMSNYINEYKGCIGKWFDVYANDIEDVGRTETLRDDLIRFLGDQIDDEQKQKIKDSGKINHNSNRDRIPEHHRQTIMECERYMVEKWGYDEQA